MICRQFDVGNIAVALWQGENEPNPLMLRPTTMRQRVYAGVEATPERFAALFAWVRKEYPHFTRQAQIELARKALSQNGVSALGFRRIESVILRRAEFWNDLLYVLGDIAKELLTANMSPGAKMAVDKVYEAVKEAQQQVPDPPVSGAMTIYVEPPKNQV